MDFDLPDREEIACALDVLEMRLVRQGQYGGAFDVGSAHRVIRQADDEIRRLEAEIAELEKDLVWAVRNGVHTDLERTEWIEYWDGEDVIPTRFDGTDADLLRAVREARRGE